MTDSMQDRETLITLTSDIVAAHVSNNDVAIDQVPALIARVFDALSGLGAEPVVPEVAPEPAVPIRASIRPDHVACLECGKKMKMLKRHLAAEHGLTNQEYRARWGLADDHALVAPNYATRRRDLAKTIGLGRKPNQETKVVTQSSAASAPAAKTKTSVDTAEIAAPKNARRRNLIRKLNQDAEAQVD